MLEGDLVAVQVYTLNMFRAYEAALEWSLSVSLTKAHCDGIDAKSQEIEVLRPQLEQKIVDLRNLHTLEPCRCSPKRLGDLRPAVELFVEHCATIRSTAQRMWRLNARIMHQPS